MSQVPTGLRRLRFIAGFAVFLGALLLPAMAEALPGDPPIVPLSPSNGATVPADEFGFHVSFQCPAYHSESPLEEEDEEGEAKEDEEAKDKKVVTAKTIVTAKTDAAAKPKSKDGDLAGADSYIVRYSTSSTVGADGLLTNTGFGDDGEDFPDPEANNKANCGSEVELPLSAGPVALYHGTIYWQAAREVTLDDPDAEPTAAFDDMEWEAGPVQSFNVVPNVEEPALETQEHIYAGYLTSIDFSTESDLVGATVELQRFVKGTWTLVAQEPASPGGQTSFYVKLPASHTALRAVLKTPTLTLPLEPTKVTVRKVGKRRATSTQDDGSYRAAPDDESTPTGHRALPLSLKVGGGGTKVLGFSASIESTCPGSTKVTTKVGIHSMRMAPDGTVVGRSLSKGTPPSYVTFVGQFFDRRLSGTLTTAFGACAGTRQIEAVAVRKSGHRSQPAGGTHSSAKAKA
jgi:hypothetical protein